MPSASKKSAKKTAPAAMNSIPGVTPKPLMSEPVSYRARIRMYRQGLGDCFLLTFPGKGDKEVHLMIDCGVVLGTSEPGAPMKAVAEDIKSTTKNKVDVLVITHEHWDHLSGFDAAQARKVFDEVEFKKLWLAWTEDDFNELAQTLRKERELKKKATLAAKKKADALKKRDKDGKLKMAERGERLNGLLGFFGAAATGEGEGSEDGEDGGGTAGALAYLKGRCDPTIIPTGGKPISIPGVDNVRVYVLGPPMKKSDLSKTNPGKGEGYELMNGGSLGLAEAFIAACDEDDDKAQPFRKEYRLPLKRLPSKHLYRLPENDWRSIDYDWLGVGERLALQLDSATNNTSLVLAFEFIDSKDVLLFVGDAQAGNWRSWDGLSFDVKDADGDTEKVTATDLLARTIFYKVGHHGSHNATLKEKGLERMKNKRLAAVIPVDVNVAHDVKRWKHMPLPSIVDALKEKCTVVFQSDADAWMPKGGTTPKYRVSDKTFAVRMKNKKTKKTETVRTEHLYHDYFL